MVPRPKSREGNSEQMCVKVSLGLLEQIDAKRGSQSRSDWGRAAFLAAIGRPSGPPRTRTRKTAPTPAVPVTFREPELPADPEPACTHPKSARLKGRCSRCKTFVGFD